MGLTHGQAIAALTGPGAPCEMEERVIRGIPTRTWKHSPPHLRALFEQGYAHGAAEFIVYEGQRLTFDAHSRAVEALADALVARFGVVKGDRVAIALRNLPEWPIAFFAAAAIGAIVVPLNAWWTGAELEYGLADSASRILICDGERLERIAPHLPVLDALKATIVVRHDGPMPTGILKLDELIGPFSAFAELPRRRLPKVDLAPEDDATIFYTSGTTGRPKGALGTQRNFTTNLVSLVFNQLRAKLRNGEPLPEPGEAVPKRSVLLSVPFFHATGCHSVLQAAYFAGNKIVLIRKWDPELALALIESEAITQFGGVPAMAWQVLEHPDFAKYDTSSIEAVSYGGAPAAAELVARIGKKFPRSTAGNGYGLTETSSVTTQNLGIDYPLKPDSVGPAVPVCDIKIVGADLAILPAGAVGEVWIKGPNVVKGYWNKPEATAETITGGWLHSGDIGRLDEEGFLYILDRAKDMLIRGGENVYCVEVEGALFSHPAVMDAAVIGLPHRILGEEVGAVVQLKPGMALDEAELKAHVAARLAAFKVPVRIEFRTEPLPRNANGKILKRQLKAEIAG